MNRNYSRTVYKRLVLNNFDSSTLNSVARGHGICVSDTKILYILLEKSVLLTQDDITQFYS